ncbi:MAG: zinc-binding dehydrogenase [Candidatus Marinimicrobia bacterium]|jgi:S-(hydroxymethyl)glutathione dehydrogenase/alcohol dehydrogenase|nr:zinc-binding dehydrogenase [Candidatus Neomarinimicrobiota bacterium]MBT3633465.1 zinc-binding dehydrogenase [Candidatus Neomarinimicrobiota bacterium]MBT3681608.1 zinc-binding dehydrogenase [Candidatus Neomarinimicrobiota bacterium]MBT3758425.1 zinc-binding dehydrogenase [Candidatus Neomarinimicrobiota bacterium]MBT3894921.1 zinc-binding dehydrogenase [Candidatus Neomarinimicrobiota bacterium]
MQTEAAILVELNAPLQLISLDIPPLKSGQVLIKVAYSGICHTQINEIDGLKGKDPYLPHTLGHEGSGIVLKTGENVSKVKAGDRVVLTWIKGYGAEIPSTQYSYLGKTVNSGAISTFMKTAIISENRLIKIPKVMPLKEAALLGCAFPTGAGIINNTCKLEANSKIAIFGIGGIGLSAVMAASAFGAKVIIAIDINDSKLEYAKTLGATHTINANNFDIIEEIKNITNNRLLDFAIEATGSTDVMEKAYSSIKPFGGLCIIAGNASPKSKIKINPMDLIQGKSIIGSWGGETDSDKDILKYCDWHQSKKISLSKLVSAEFPLHEINTAISNLKAGINGRALINMNSIENEVSKI